MIIADCEDASFLDQFHQWREYSANLGIFLGFDRPEISRHRVDDENSNLGFFFESLAYRPNDAPKIKKRRVGGPFGFRAGEKVDLGKIAPSGYQSWVQGLAHPPPRGEDAPFAFLCASFPPWKFPAD